MVRRRVTRSAYLAACIFDKHVECMAADMQSRMPGGTGPALGAGSPTYPARRIHEGIATESTLTDGKND
jgi:hypothetical protein